MRRVVRRPWIYSALAVVALVALALAVLVPRWLDHPTIPMHTALYLTDQGERLSAVDPRTGALLWQSRLFGMGTGAALADGTVYTGGSAGYVHAFDAATGAVRWTVKITSDSEMPVNLTTGNGMVYVSTLRFSNHTSHLFALRAGDGATLWSVAFDGYLAAPTISGGQLISAWSASELMTDREHGALYALRAGDGATLWRTPMPGRPYTQPVVVGDRVYMSTEIGYVVAYDAQTGAERWRYQPPHSEIGLSSLDTSGGLIYVCVQRTFYALRAADGSLRWQVTVPGSADRNHQQYAPTVVHGILYALANNDETLYALKPDTGGELWEYDGIGFSMGGVAVDRGVAYFGTGDGGIVALRESDGTFIKRLDLSLFAEGPISVRGAA